MPYGEARNVFRLQWSTCNWVLSTQKTTLFVWSARDTSKKQAIKLSAKYARDTYVSEGSYAQLVVHNKNGRIAFERTYGADPRRSKG